jgi:hypothetical protein
MEMRSVIIYGTLNVDEVELILGCRQAGKSAETNTCDVLWWQIEYPNVVIAC